MGISIEFFYHYLLFWRRADNDIRDGAKFLNVISKVLKSKIGQLDKLRNFKAYDREIEERQAENNYNVAQKLIAAQERKRREHQYKLAVEYRRSLEATAYRWYNYWGLRYPSNIYIVR